jgi:hypothetical protein
VNRVTSDGLGFADPPAESRRLFDISSRLLAQTLPYARRLDYCLSLYPVRNIHAITAMHTAMIARVTATLDQTGTSATE